MEFDWSHERLTALLSSVHLAYFAVSEFSKLLPYRTLSIKLSLRFIPRPFRLLFDPHQGLSKAYQSPHSFSWLLLTRIQPLSPKCLSAVITFSSNHRPGQNADCRRLKLPLCVAMRLMALADSKEPVLVLGLLCSRSSSVSFSC